MFSNRKAYRHQPLEVFNFFNEGIIRLGIKDKIGNSSRAQHVDFLSERT